MTPEDAIYEAPEAAQNKQDTPVNVRPGLSLLTCTGIALVAFTFGIGTGIIIDGNAEVLNDFKSTHLQSSATPTLEQDTLLERIQLPQDADGLKSGNSEIDTTNNTPFPENNTVEWGVSVAPGTPLQQIEIANNSGTQNARIDFLAPDHATGKQSVISSIWVRANQEALISLPWGDYLAASSLYPANQPYDPKGTRKLSKIAMMRVERLDPDQTAPYITGNAQGRFSLIPSKDIDLNNPPKQTKPKPQTRALKHDEPADYGRLGKSSHTGGSATYGQ